MLEDTNQWDISKIQESWKPREKKMQKRQKNKETVVSIGIKIGQAIAKDVIAEDMPREWTGLDPQDFDQIPEGMDIDVVEKVAKREYLRILKM